MRQCKKCGARVPDKARHQCSILRQVVDADDDSFFVDVVDTVAEATSHRSHHHSGSSWREIISDIFGGDSSDSDFDDD